MLRCGTSRCHRVKSLNSSRHNSDLVKVLLQMLAWISLGRTDNDSLPGAKRKQRYETELLTFTENMYLSKTFIFSALIHIIQHM